MVFEQLEQARASLGSWAEIGKRLKLNDAGMSQFTLLLRHFQQLVPNNESAQSATSHQVIAALRYVSWLEKMREKQPALKWTASLPASDAESQFKGKAQIRAVELTLRQLINRAWPDKVKLSTHLTTLLGVSAVKRSQSQGEKGDIISGLMFSELASVLVDKREFNRFYASVFNASSQGFWWTSAKHYRHFLMKSA
ncbi:STY4199 family HEPN domain-containing protein [Mangrovibacter sp. SLW1]